MPASAPRPPRHLAGARLLAQGLIAPADGAPTPTPARVARSFGAHQGQDLAGVVSSLALRSGGRVEPVLEAFDRGEIVRGYPMRGTVFALAADTLAWLTELCAAGPVRAAITRRPTLGLDEAQVARAGEVLAELLAPVSDRGAGRGALRAEVMQVWEDAGIATTGGRGYHLLTHHLSTGLVAYGPWREGETAVVLASSWLPPGSDLAGAFGGDRIAAVAELTRRYLITHGPASERDLAWWSKLPLGEIRAALPQVEAELESGWADTQGHLHADAAAARRGGGERLWWRPGLAEEYAAREKESMRELLLPGFDELVLGYRDRLFLMDEDRHDRLVPGNNGVFKRAALRRGEVVGFWSRTGTAGKRKLVLEELTTISPTQRGRFERLFRTFPTPVP